MMICEYNNHMLEITRKNITPNSILTQKVRYLSFINK